MASQTKNPAMRPENLTEFQCLLRADLPMVTESRDLQDSSAATLIQRSGFIPELSASCKFHEGYGLCLAPRNISNPKAFERFLVYVDSKARLTFLMQYQTLYNELFVKHALLKRNGDFIQRFWPVPPKTRLGEIDTFVETQLPASRGYRILTIC